MVAELLYFAAKLLIKSLYLLACPGKAGFSGAGGVSGSRADEGVTDLDLEDVSGVPGLSLSFLTLLLDRP